MYLCLSDSSPLLRRPARLGYSGLWKSMVFPLVLLLFLVVPVSRAAGCVYLDDYGAQGNVYVDFAGGNFLHGDLTVFGDDNCQTQHSYTVYTYAGFAYANNVQAAWSICESNIDHPIDYVDLIGSATNIYRCDLTEDDDESPVERHQVLGLLSSQLATNAEEAVARCQNSWPETNRAVFDFPNNAGTWTCLFVWTLSRGSRGSRGGGGAYFRDIPTLPLFGLKLRAFDGVNTGIQFRRLTQYYVGIQSVLDMGVLDAVDVWSNIGSGYEVCFSLPGRVVLLDAATAPRTVVEQETYAMDRFTCASSDRAGTMVLVEPEESAPTQATAQVTTRRPGTNDSVDTAIALEDCVITPRFNLRLRAAPWGKILDIVPVGATVVATARTKSWFQLTYEEQEGWSAAWLADSEGDCEWPDEPEVAGAEST